MLSLNHGEYDGETLLTSPSSSTSPFRMRRGCCLQPVAAAASAAASGDAFAASILGQQRPELVIGQEAVEVAVRVLHQPVHVDG